MGSVKNYYVSYKSVLDIARGYDNHSIASEVVNLSFYHYEGNCLKMVGRCTRTNTGYSCQRSKRSGSSELFSL